MLKKNILIAKILKTLNNKMTNETLNPNRPNPIDKEVFWDKTLTIVSKSDLLGTIEYANEAFADVSGYEEYELVGKPHSLIRHPDMPKVLYKILWDNLKEGKPFQIIFKNLSKSGRYYWVISEFEYSKDDSGNIINYISRRNAVANEVLEGHIIPLYKKLLQIEEASGLKYSEKYMIGFLEEKGLSFTDYIFSLVNDGKTVPQAIINLQEPEKIVVEKKPAAIKEEVIVPQFEKVTPTPEIVSIPEEMKPKVVQEVQPKAEIQDKIEEINHKVVQEVQPKVEIQEKVEVEKINAVIYSKITNDNADVIHVNKVEVKPNENDLNEDNSSDYEEVERETRTGFIGKLFGRE